MKALEPQFVRIFYNENWEANSNNAHPEWPQNLESFKDTVQLADESGATDRRSPTRRSRPPRPTRPVDVALRRRPARPRRDPRPDERALGHDRRTSPIRRHLTLAAVRGALPRARRTARGTRTARADRADRRRPRREHRGDTVRGHRAWFDYMVAHMNDVIDAWSEHIYWNYDDHVRMEERLKDVAHLVDQELPVRRRESRRSSWSTAFAATTRAATKPQVTAAYYRDADCTDLRRMSLAGVPEAVVQRSTRRSSASTVRRTGTSTGATYDLHEGEPVILDDRAAGGRWALYPSVLRAPALLPDDGRGWQVLGVDPWTAGRRRPTRYDDTDPDQPEQELTAYSGPDGQLTVLGLDTNGGNARRAERRVVLVQHRRAAAEHDVHARALERNRRRQELGRGHDHHERRRRRTVRRTAAGGIRPDDGPRLVGRPCEPGPLRRARLTCRAR